MSSSKFRKRQPRKRTSAPKTQAAPPLPQSLSRRVALFSGVGLTLTGGGACGAQFGTSAWFNAQQSGVVPAAIAAPTGTNSTSNLSSRVVTPDEALVRAQRSIANLSRAAEMIAAAQTAQTAARQLALSGASTVANGLQAGGLQVASGVSTDSTLWQNAALPTETTADGQTTVTVKQNASKAILTWDSFNVGRETTLHFDQTSGTQSDGSNTWIALNRVTDVNAKPSQILGSIQAEGSVYLINRNGIIFGGSSQVNTQSFLVSSLYLYSDDVATSNSMFLSGEQNIGASNSNAVLGGDFNFASQAELDNWQAPGDVEIQAGAQIVTGTNGYALIAAPNVRNAGTILAQDGQAVLVAGVGIALNSSALGVTVASDLLNPNLVGNVRLNGVATDRGLGTVENTGLIGASRGNVTIVGYDVEQSGIVEATTSISRPGTLYIAAQDSRTVVALGGTVPATGGILNLSSNSLTAILPDADGETTTSSSTADSSFTAPTAVLAGAQLTLQDSALVYAPGAEIDLLGWASQQINGQANLTDRIDIGHNAVIDVSGLADVQLAMSANEVEISLVGLNELADSPLARDGVLYGESVTVDGRQSGTRSDGLAWFGSPLLNIGGYIDNQPRKIDQMLTEGGTINFVGRELITRSGSVLNLDGGYIHYLGGRVETTRLLGADGRLYDISQADSDVEYLGIAGQYTVNYSRWNVSDSYTDPLLSGKLGHYETDYIVGGDGGTLNVVMTGTTLLNGDISAQALSGRYQVADAQLAEGGSFNFGINSSLLGWAFDTSVAIPNGQNVIVTAEAADVSDDFGVGDAASSLPGSDLAPTDPDNPLYWTELSAATLSEAGFSHLAIGNANHEVLVDEGASLKVQDGGSISLTGARVEIYGDLTAHSGAISASASGLWDTLSYIPLDSETGLSARGDIIVGGQARLDASGQWVNDAYLGIDEQMGAAAIDGGSITLTTHQYDLHNLDWSGAITLQSGAVLDVSGGGRVLPDGTLASESGVPLGQGGDISLLTYVRQAAGSSSTSYNQFSARYAAASDSVGILDIEGAQLLGDGLAGGGTLSLRALNIQIGGEPQSADPRALYLASDFFSDQGFSAYDLSAELDATIAAGAQVNISHRNLIPDVRALVQAPTGTDIFSGAYGVLGTLDDYHRGATDFSLSAGDYVGRVTGNPAPSLAGVTGTVLVGEGASLLLDAGSSVRLGSRNQVTVLGTIVAHGGSITLSADTTSSYGEAPPTADHLTGTTAYASSSKSVWVGANAVLDVSGVSLINPLESPISTADGWLTPHTGTVLDGGTVTLSNDTGYVVVESGARIDLSGAADLYDIAEAGEVGTQLTSHEVWSDAGTLTLAASSGLFFDGTISAHGGASAAEGGTLVLRPLTSTQYSGGVASTGILFYQDGSRLSEGLAPGDVVEADLTSPSGVLNFAAERLDDSGITTLIAGSKAGRDTLKPIGFAGDVNLTLDREIELNASSFVALPENAANFSATGNGGVVNLSAAYVSLTGLPEASRTLSSLALPGTASLSVHADWIDLGGRFSLANFGNAEFASTGDIRFYTPAAYAYSGTDETPITGQLLSAGDITFSAAQLYPATNNIFAVVAVGATDPSTGQARETTITIKGNGQSSDAPLSAGGTLLFDATYIEQQGTIRAPAGQIVLGVDDPGNADVLTLFGNLPLTATQSVRLADGSLTSVSLEGLTVPWGTTVDEVDWQDNSSPYVSSPSDLSEPPEKQIVISGVEVSLDDGAIIDLSGGGELYATEWISGTGGTRDLLSRTNTVYSGDTQTEVPLYSDGRAVYAIVPGEQSVTAPYDPAYDTGDLQIGQSVYLSGIDGIPAGIYTLMPAQYANLPGAYRVVQDTSSIDASASQNATLADGTLRISGYYVDNLTGAHDSRSTSFLVQSSEVWGQYSEYAVTSADSYFTELAESQGTSLPQLLQDAGRLTVSATQSLSLDATLKTAAAEGGAGAQVDIASARIQITGAGATALDGYLQLDAQDLNSLGAASLLLGGARSQSTDGVTIDAKASSLIVSNDAQSALSGPEILLVTNGGSGAAGDGLQITSGSVIRADGDVPGSSSVPITIGREADSDNDITAVSGDGALLRVSNGAPVLVNRYDITGSGGLLQIDAGAILDGGASLSLDATGDTRLDGTAVLTAKAIDANSSLISFVSNTADGAALHGLVIGPETLAQLANTESITLRSRGDLQFIGGLDVSLDDAELSLSAGRFVGDGSDVHLSAQTVTLSNELNTEGTTGAVTGGTLRLDADTVQFGPGTARVDSFADVQVNATEMITGRGTGVTDFGSAAVTMMAPAFVAGSVADTTVQTTGALLLSAGAGDLSTSVPLGGALTLIGGSVNSSAYLAAAAGQINLRATQGDLTLAEGTVIDVSGVAQDFYDVTEYVGAGAIGLSSDNGNVKVASGATLDFSGASGGGSAGSLSVSAAHGAAELNGELLGQAVAGETGGSFSLDSGSAVGLDALAEQLTAGGINGAIVVQSRSGNLELSAGHTLSAQTVQLIADGGTGGHASGEGHVLIEGTIDASGEKGGEIDLYGRSGVDVEGTLLARGSSAEEQGGTVRLYTSGVTDGTYNIDYGYENVTHDGSGSITIGDSALIDVSGGTAGGLSGGTLQIRAPLLNDEDVNVALANAAQITGAREVGLEAYAVWSTTDATSAGKHFDGIVDPAGWYNSQGQLLPGTFTDQDGNSLGSTGDLSTDYFAPTSANTDHVGFYQTTLAGFVQQPEFAFESRFAQVTNFVARSGVELRNPSPEINDGKISVLTNWNLGATDAAGNFIYRHGNAAPVLTIRSTGTIEVKASITDGFHEYSNPAGSISLPAGSTLTLAQTGLDLALNDPTEGWYSLSQTPAPVSAPAQFSSGNASQISTYYGYYKLYVDFLNSDIDPANWGQSVISMLSYFAYMAEDNGLGYTTYPGQPTAPVRPTSPVEYADYLAAYQTYLTALYQIWLDANGTGGPAPTIEWLQAPQAILFDPADYVPTNNSAAPMPSMEAAIPLHTANIISGESSSYRLVAGSDFTSTDPMALMNTAAEELFSGASDVTLDGHFSYVASSGSTIELPTLLRTGTGSIEIAAARDIRLDDSVAPAVIYSAGRLADGVAAGGSADFHTASPNSAYSTTYLVTSTANPVAGGDVDLFAGRDVIGNQQIYDVDGSVTGRAGSYIGQYWWEWMQTGNSETASSINFGNFDQGVMSIGGDVSVSAGRDIRELSVSLPTTWTLTTDDQNVQQLNIYGGGDLSVLAGRDILSGAYFVSKGSGTLQAGGSIGHDFTLSTRYKGASYSTPVATMLGLQDADWHVTARQGAEIGGIYNPSYVRNLSSFFESADSQAYSADSSVSITSTSGDIALSTLTLPATLFSYGSVLTTTTLESQITTPVFDDILPARLEAVAFNGSLSVEAGGVLFPSAEGELNLFASDSLRLFNRRTGYCNSSAAMCTNILAMSNLDAATDFPSPFNKDGWSSILRGSGAIPTLSSYTDLHANDSDPVRLYAVDGDITSGFVGTQGGYLNPLTLYVPKPAIIRAGRDIVNLDFRGQNYHDTDVTSIIAGRDILDTTPGNTSTAETQAGYQGFSVGLALAGTGTFNIEAGRNLGPLSDAITSTVMTSNKVFLDIEDSSEQKRVFGIRTTGNVSDLGNGASLNIRYGVGRGIATDEFAARYLDPSQHEAGIPNYDDELVAFMNAYFADHPDEAVSAGGALTVEAAWTAFQKLPEYRRQLLVDQVFLGLLAQVGRDYQDPESDFFQQYARGYEAINTLFPSSYGYTANNLEGGATNGANEPVTTGNLDMRGSTIQTRGGGDISILAPGGQLLVGSAAAPPTIIKNGSVVVGPNNLGILTLQSGSIGIFSDRSVLLAQSRIFTEQGGDITMWSSNGDINAGKGSKTSTELASVTYTCDEDHYCRVDNAGQVSGAGIASLQTIPGAPAGDAVLVAPRGTVDAGEAGIRVSGNLVISAFAVAHADNIQVQGDAVGVPSTAVNVGALNAANSAAAAAQQSAAELSAQRPPERAASMIKVDVVGYGEPDEAQKKKMRGDPR